MLDNAYVKLFILAEQIISYYPHTCKCNTTQIYTCIILETKTTRDLALTS